MNDSTNSNRGNKRSKGTTRRLQSLSGDEEDDDFEDDLELHKREKAAEQRKWESILRAQVVLQIMSCVENVKVIE